MKPVIVHTASQRYTLMAMLAGQSPAEIAEQRGTSRDSVYAQLVRLKRINNLNTVEELRDAAKQRGVAMSEEHHRGGNKSKKPPAEVLERYARMLTSREITRARMAKELGVAPCTAMRWIPAVSKGDYRQDPTPIDKAAISKRIRQAEAEKRVRLLAELKELR